MPSGVAQGDRVTSALERVGINVAGFRWLWQPGVKGEAFPRHQGLNGQFRSDTDDFPVLPQEDVNGDYCQCLLVQRYRDTRGRFVPEVF